MKYEKIIQRGRKPEQLVAIRTYIAGRFAVVDFIQANAAQSQLGII